MLVQISPQWISAGSLIAQLVLTGVFGYMMVWVKNQILESRQKTNEKIDERFSDIKLEFARRDMTQAEIARLQTDLKKLEDSHENVKSKVTELAAENREIRGICKAFERQYPRDNK